MYDDDDKKDDGSVWTSYSDLFTTVAVIFLVMFVFALIKASVTKMQAVVEKNNHENELKGKISSNTQKQTESKINKVSKSINEIDQYENLIDEKMKAMDQFVKKLKSSKSVMKELIKDQERKEAQLHVVSQKIEELETDLKEEKTQNTKLEERIKSKIAKIAKVIQENEEIQAQKAQLDKIVIDSKNEIKETELKNKDLSLKLQVEEEKLKNKIIEEEKIQKTLKETITKLEEKKISNESLTQQLADQTRQKVETQKSLDQLIQETKVQKNQLSQKIESITAELKKSESIVEDKTKLIEENKREIASFQNEVKDLNNWKMQNTAKLNQIENNLAQTTKVKESQSKQIEELTKYKNDLENQKKQLERNLVSEAEVVKKLGQELEGYKTQLSEQKNLNTQSVQKISQLSKDLNTQKTERAEIYNNLQAANQKITELNQLTQSQNLRLTKGNQEQKRLAQELAKAGRNIGQLESQLKQEQAKGSQLASKNEGLHSKNSGLHKKTIDLSDALERALKELGVVKEQNVALGAENSKFLGFKKDLNAKMENLRGQMHGLRSENKRLLDNWNLLNDDKIARENIIAKMQETKAELMKRLALLEGRLNNKAELSQAEAASLQKEINALKEKNNYLKNTLQDFAQKVVDVKDKLRNNIAKRLAKEFKKADINVHVDEKTGNVVLLMNENFRFAKNSHKLNASARNTLKKIIPIYSEVLFGNEQVKESIQSFNVVGHASPNHQGRYVEPLAHNNVAYSYNMRLSAQRAASVANYIFGSKIGSYHYKRFLKSFTSAIGQGYTKPVKALQKLQNGRGLASVKESNCGPYDCYASQRVELSFTLKDDVESLNKIINMAKSVK